MHKVKYFFLYVLLILGCFTGIANTAGYLDERVSWSGYLLDEGQKQDLAERFLAKNEKNTLDNESIQSILATDAIFALAVTITPPENKYFYDISTTYGLPTFIDGVAIWQEGEQTATRQLTVLIPPPVAKVETAFVNEKLTGVDDYAALIYPEATTFILLVPNIGKPISININIQALFCSAKSCMPYYGSLDMELAPSEVASFEHFPTLLWEKLADFSLAAVVGATGDINVSGVEGNLSLYESFVPQYYNESLEVSGLWQAIILGMLAGFVLNLMPCVLPVISLKFSALLAVTGMDNKQDKIKAFRSHCLFFALGVMVWFGVLALLLGVVGLAWGGLFQNPYVVAGLGFLLFLLSLSLFNVFTLPVLDLKVASSSNPHLQAFGSGVLATLLATPCSGPLLGGVLGWAISQPLYFLALTVLSVGLGMAMPYILMVFFPGLIRFLPKPGTWTLRLEQILGFFLMGTVAYMSTLLPAEWLPAFAFNLVTLAFAAWLWGQIGHLGASRRTRFFARLSAIFLMILSLMWGASSLKEDTLWENFNPLTFEEILGKENILLEFTADWCPSCKVMEYTTLNEKRMRLLQNKYKMRIIRVDLTRRNPDGEALLESLGSSSIPVIALFGQGEQAKKPLVLRDLVTPNQLDEALQATFGR